MKTFILTTILALTIISTYAQDKIFRKNGQKLIVKIIEVGSTDIKYKPIDDPNGPVYVLERDRITKIEYENGRVEKFMTDLKDPEMYKDQLTKAFKINFMAPLLGYSEFSYEKSIGVGKSYELSLGIIGLGKSTQLNWYNNGVQQETHKNQFGLYAGAGYKFNKLPDFLFGRTRFSHIMQGSYAKPQFYFGNYSENIIAYKSGGQSVEKANTTFSAIEIEFGKQWVFGDKLLIDSFWGLGYGFDNKNDGSAYNYGVARLGNSPGVALSFGLRLGLLVK